MVSIDSSTFDQFIRGYSAAVGITVTIGLLALLGTRMLINASGHSVTPFYLHLLDGCIAFLLIVFVGIVVVRFHVLA